MDWKIHKLMCPILKRLSNKLQPFQEVICVIDEVDASEKGNDRRILEHLLSYAEYQFGKQVTGIGYRERDGQRISNWTVETFYFYEIYNKLINSWSRDRLISRITCQDKMGPYLERSLSLLNIWLTHLNSGASNRNDDLHKDQLNQILDKLIYTEQNIAVIAVSRREFDVAEGHCQRCLAYSRRYGLEGEIKTTSIFNALSTYCSLREHQGDCSGALTFAEDCYNLVAEAYDPVHQQVQQAAGVLIDLLIKKGDLCDLEDAERYAQITYSNLRDSKNGMDQEGEDMAIGSFNLANVIYRRKGDLMKAEELAREAIRIRTSVYGSDHSNISLSYNLLALIMVAQRKLGDETRGLFERFIAMSIRNEGVDAANAAVGNFDIGEYYYELAGMQLTVESKRTQLLLAKSHIEEAHRISSKIHGPTNVTTAYASSRLALLLSELS